MGRPSKLNEELMDKARSWAKVSNDTILTITGLCLFLGVSRSTVYKWGDENDEFSDILEEIMMRQEQKLLFNGLEGEFNSTITKLMLTKHGYSDKQDIDHTTKGDKVQSISPHQFVGEDT